jgi:hypothetical protein
MFFLYRISCTAGVAELADARDLKSLVGNRVPVRVRSPAPIISRLHRLCSEGFVPPGIEKTHAASRINDAATPAILSLPGMLFK